MNTTGRNGEYWAFVTQHVASSRKFAVFAVIHVIHLLFSFASKYASSMTLRLQMQIKDIAWKESMLETRSQANRHSGVLSPVK